MPKASGKGSLARSHDKPRTPNVHALRVTDRWARVRPVIARIRPQVDCGRYPAKATVGDLVHVECDAFTDGSDLVSCDLLYAFHAEPEWTAAPMRGAGNDRWVGAFPVGNLGHYRFAVRAAIDAFGTWRRDLHRREEAGQDLSLELVVGAEVLERAAERATGADRRALRLAADELRNARALTGPVEGPIDPVGDGTLGALVDSDWLGELVARHPDLSLAAESDALLVVVDPLRARFGSWYELFPRSTSPDPSRAGTLTDVRGRLAYLARLGIDVLYLPPIHPIGTTNRKGTDGTVGAGPSDPGSPWAIGGPRGGHTAIDPALGSIDELDLLVAEAAELGIDIALDLAFQASPDHPWVGEHPEWFRHRPDGSIRYAENPPKRYEDIYPLDFETDARSDLWDELLEVVRYWIGHGITVFRVDNPHTKPFRFWQWLIGSVKAQFPEVIFLSEAFTRPRVMEHLAKVGFSQSYTYFAWRNSKWELETYLRELTQSEVADYLRPNLWPNTPDILTELLQIGGRPAFMARLVLAATLGASYGIYGPPFELQEHVARSPGSEEYHDSEKYAVRHWDLEQAESLADLVGRVNEIRRRHRALHRNDTLAFHQVDNDQIIAYSKIAPHDAAFGHRVDDEAPDTIVVVVNLDPFHAQSGWVHLDISQLDVEVGRPYVMHDLLTNAHYRWEGSRNFVILDPAAAPAHVFSLERPRAAVRAAIPR